MLIFTDKNQARKAISTNNFENYNQFINFFDDKEFILESIKLWGYYGKFMSDRLKDDIDIANELIKINGSYIEFLNDRFKKSESFVIKSIKNNPSAFEFIDKSLHDNKNILELAISLDTFNITKIDENNPYYKEMIIKAIEKDVSIIIHLPKYRSLFTQSLNMEKFKELINGQQQ